MPATWTDPRTWVDLDLVTAADLNEQVRDNLLWLKERPIANESDFDGTFFNTTSSTWQDTGADAALTTTGGRVLVVAFGGVYVGGSSTAAHLTLYQDGSNVGNATEGMMQARNPANALYSPFAIVYITPAAPTAAAHTWKLYMKSSDNAANVYIRAYQMWAIEIGA